MLQSTIFNAVIPMPIILHGNSGGCEPKIVIALCASIAIVGLLVMLLSFAYHAIKSYLEHKKYPQIYSFTFSDILDDVSENVVFMFGLLMFLAIVLIAIIGGFYILFISL